MVAIRHTWDKTLRKMVTIRTGGHIKEEYALMSSFDSPYIIKPVELRGDSLVLPYFPERGADGAAGYCTERLAWKFMHDVASALVLIHEKGYVHNDIKPSGVLIGDECFVLCDFGACMANSKSGRTDADDIWSLGDAVFQMIMGMGIFNGKGRKAQKKDTVIPTLRRDIYSQELSDIIARCLSFNPQDRPKAEAVAAEAARMMNERKGTKPEKHWCKPDSGMPYEDIWPESMTI